MGVAAGAFSGVAAASTDALPGDTLYGLKRGMEDLRLNLADGDADRGKVLLDMASTRLQETRRLLERRRSGPLDGDSVREVRRALSGMHKEADQGHRLLSGAYRRDGSLAPMEVLNTFSRTHRDAWGRVRGQLPPQLADVGDQVTKVFNAIEHEVAPLQGLLPKDGQNGPRGGSGAPRTSSPSAHSRNRSSTPTAGSTGPASDARGDARSSDPTGPTATESPGDGLLGGSGLLTPPLAGGSPSPSSGRTTDSGSKPQPEATLPPLLPGLLPGLTLGDGDLSK